MVTDTFFDLQRFDEGDGVMTTTALLGANNAKDTLVGSSVSGGVSFAWQNGSTFVNDGTAENPVYHLDITGAGSAAVTSDSGQIALHGTKDGYTFAVNENKTNWEVSLQGVNNVIGGNFSQEGGSYGLNGTATVKVYAGRSFDETLNGDAAYIKAANAADVPVTVSSNGTTAINYTIEGSDAAAVVVDNDDTVVFAQDLANRPAEMTLGAAANPGPQAASIPGVYFYNDKLYVDANNNPVSIAAQASVTATEDNSAVKISVKDSVTVGISDDAWVFSNKSTRDDAVLIVNDPNATGNDKIFTGEVSSVAATDGATVRAADDGIENPVNVNGTQWTRIIAEEDANVRLPVIFDESGNATIENTVLETTTLTLSPRVNGGVTVDGAAGATAEFETITATGVITNGTKIQANGAVDDIKVTLEAGGISAIGMDLDDDPVTVTGDQIFDVKLKGANDVFGVTTTADSIAVDINRVITTGTGTDNDPSYLYVSGNTLYTRVNHNQAYTVTGGEAVYQTETVVAGGQMAVSINGAAVQINNNDASSADNYGLSSDAKKAGIDEAMLLKPNDAIKVTGDSDGYTAVYAAATNYNGVVTFNVNDAKISVKAGDVDADLITVVAGADNQVTVQGIEGNAVVSVDASAGTVYHFKNELGRNAVTVNSADALVEVTLTSGGDVMKDPVSGRVDDLIDDVDMKAVDADQAKWDAIGVVGKSSVVSPTNYDTVESHHAKVYENFYDLINSSVSGNTTAGFENPDDENPTEGSSNINIHGESPLGTDASVGEAVHITLSGNAAVGSVPINIQKDENSNVTDVTVALGNASVPSTVAVGTIEQRDTNNNVVPVAASHNIQLSNAGTADSPSYGYLGQYATGQNVLSGGTGNNMLRHDGENRTSLYGGASNDTIRGDVNDVVSGGLEADYFYDLSGYALDYNVAEGDIIIASRLANIGEVTQANIWGNGNQIAFGNHGEYYLTLGNIDPNAAVHVKVATMDDDGNIMKGVKDVVLANGNGVVDASAAGDNGALIIADSTRGDGVHAVSGSTGNDTIHSGAFDTVNGGAGNDDIYIENGAGAAGAVVVLGGGDDSVTGWTFGFDRAAGATQLDAGGLQVVGRVFEDRMYVSLVGGEASISFNDTAALGNSDTATMHGQYDVLVDDRKFTMIRNGDARTGYAIVDSNDKIADYYMAEREGEVHFTGNVTDLIGDETRVYGMGVVDLTTENFHAIRNLDLQNNSKTVVYGSTGRETVTTGGQAVLGANKFVSLGADNDVIISGGDGNPSLASNAFFFGAGDGRDTVYGYNHYQGINADPDKQSADLIVLQSFAGLKSEYNAAENSVRVEFALSADTAANEYALIYENAATYDYNSNMYRVQITDTGSEGIAKIGYSTTDNPTGTGNIFTYDKEVSYYVGSSGEARDTLVINTVNENVEVRMDGQKQDGKFYRGIGAIDASAAAYTNTTLAGNAADNLIVAGGEGTNNFMWGGAGSNTLVGGAGKDFFLYTKNANAYVADADHSDTSGTNDLITGYDCNNDVIILSDVTLADINYAAMLQAGGTNNSNCGITENAVTVALNNGGSVTVNPAEQSKVTFYINDGAGNLTAFSANRDTGTWSRG